jgi:hypothetical protein
MRRFALFLALVSLSHAIFAADSAPKIVVIATSTPASGQAATVASKLEDAAATNLLGQYSCATVVWFSEALNGSEGSRLKTQINSGPGSYRNIASTLGAQWVVAFTVSQNGSSLAISASAIDAGNGEVFKRDSASLPSSSSALAVAAKSFANSFTQSLGERGPRCSTDEAKPWKGTLSESWNVTAPCKPGPNPDNCMASVQELVRCQINGGKATCIATYSSSITGKGMTGTQHAEGKASTTISISTLNNKASINVEGFKIKGTCTMQTDITGSTASPCDEFFGDWNIAAPTPPGEHEFAGAWQANQVNFEWHLSR